MSRSLDYREIRDGASFEDFAEELLRAMGLAPARKGVGPDGGVDIVVSDRVGSEIEGPTTRNWIVQCKHLAHSGRFYGERLSVHDSLVRHQATGFLLIVSTRVTVTVKDTIEKYRATRPGGLTACCWTPLELEQILRAHPEIARKYFPVSYSNWIHDGFDADAVIRQYSASCESYIRSTIGHKYLASIHVERQLERRILQLLDERVLDRDEVETVITRVGTLADQLQATAGSVSELEWTRLINGIGAELGHFGRDPGSTPQFGASPSPKALGNVKAVVTNIEQFAVSPDQRGVLARMWAGIKEMDATLKFEASVRRRVAPWKRLDGSLLRLMSAHAGQHLSHPIPRFVEEIEKELSLLETSCVEVSRKVHRACGGDAIRIDEGVQALRAQIRAAHHEFAECAAGSKPLVLVVDRAGSGKTSSFCKLAETIGKDRVCVFVSAKAVPDCSSAGIHAHIASHYRQVGTDGQTMESPWRQRFEKSPVIIIDGINEHPSPRSWKLALKQFVSSLQATDARVVISCRDVYWQFFDDEFWKTVTVEEIRGQLYEFTDEEFRSARPQYLRAFCISVRLSGRANVQLHHPLLLRFFCEAYKGTPDSPSRLGAISSIRLKRLFDDYSRRKFREISERMALSSTRGIEAYVTEIATAMMHGGARLLRRDALLRSPRLAPYCADPDELGSHYTELRDENIIIDEGPAAVHGEISISFVYEEYMEYVIARDVVARVRAAGGEARHLEVCLRELESKEDAFIWVAGALEYVVAFVGDECPHLLHPCLQFLLAKARLGTAARAIRRLAREQVSPEIFQILTEVHTHGSVSDDALRESWSLLVEYAAAHRAAASKYLARVVREARCSMRSAVELGARLCDQRAAESEVQGVCSTLLNLARQRKDSADTRTALACVLQLVQGGRLCSAAARTEMWQEVLEVLQPVGEPSIRRWVEDGWLRKLHSALENRSRTHLEFERHYLLAN